VSYRWRDFLWELHPLNLACLLTGSALHFSGIIRSGLSKPGEARKQDTSQPRQQSYTAFITSSRAQLTGTSRRNPGVCPKSEQIEVHIPFWCGTVCIGSTTEPQERKHTDPRCGKAMVLYSRTNRSKNDKAERKTSLHDSNTKPQGTRPAPLTHPTGCSGCT
jgi:hypothetical protein